jgi:ubiquinone/menaquinone biosynthesis C-methylase UbiE
MSDTFATSGFDRLAPDYQALWSGTSAGRLQREEVWRHITELFPPGSHVLDLGCGTGDDALMLATRGVRVTGIDSSSEMVRIARNRGVDARFLPIEHLSRMESTFDHVLSDFGVLNCIDSLSDLRAQLRLVIRPSGTLAVVLMTRFCLWESVWFAAQGRFSTAVRRWNGRASSSVSRHVFYPTVEAIQQALAPDFNFVTSHGIGVAVPPSYVTGISRRSMDRLALIDKRLASLPIFREIGDHRLLIFRRVLTG